MNKLDRRVALLGLGVVAVIALVVGIVLKSDPDDDQQVAATTSREAAERVPEKKATEPASTEAPKVPKVPTIVVRDGEPIDGVADLTYDQGERVRFRVTSDAAEEIHLHGYDISEEVAPGGAATFDFPAELEGVFEVELEERATPIAELTVEP
jgi:hypothetical protein